MRELKLMAPLIFTLIWAMVSMGPMLYSLGESLGGHNSWGWAVLGMFNFFFIPWLVLRLNRGKEE